MTTRKKNIKDSHDVILKVIIIGDSGVGKTNFLTRYCQGIFKDNYVATIGVDFKIKMIDSNGQKVKLQIWDTAGQQRFKNITQTYFRGAAGIILVYAINNHDSFRNINNWLKQIENNSSQDSCKILIGTKSDLNSDRQVSTEQAIRLAQKHNMTFMQVSAKSGQNINQAFLKLAQKIIQKRIQKNPGLDLASGVSLMSRRDIQKKKCQC